MDKLIEGVINSTLSGEIKSLNDLKEVCEFIKNTTSLRTLWLSHNQIGNEGCRYLADALKYNHSIQELNLYRNQIGNEGCRYLANAFKNNHSLQKLYLCHNQIGNEGHNYFWNKFNYSNNKIQILSLSCEISELVFFHKHLCLYNFFHTIKQQKWFIQNYKHRNTKLWLLLFLKN